MTLDSKVKEELRHRHPASFSYVTPVNNFTILVVDFMQFLKSTVPDYTRNNQSELVGHFVRMIFGLLDRAPIVVVCVDKASPIVKQMVCHGNRYEKRCKKCKAKTKELPSGKRAPRECFDPSCEKQCFENQILYSSEGPYLPEDNQTPLPFTSWSQFCSDSGNLRYELYPRMVNAILSATLPPGKKLFLNGFPIKLKDVQEWVPNSTFLQKGGYERRVIVDTWTYADLPLKVDAKTFGHTLCIEGSNKWVDESMFNMIAEADNTIFYMLSFFPEHSRHAVYINDGDAISIGLFLAHEYCLGKDEHNNPIYSHELYLMMPNKSKKKYLGGPPPPFEYISLTKLHNSIQNMPEFQEAGVQCPFVTVIFLIILSGTDFFRNFCDGIGIIREWSEDEEKRENQTYNIWETFYSKLDMYSHLVQYYRGENSVKTERRVVLDEKLFQLFEQECYINKYAKSVSKKRKKLEKEVSFEDIQIHCSKNLKDASRHPPPDNVMSRQCRQIDFNLNYWANALRGIELDPFEQDNNGNSYYGYKKSPVPHVVDIVASKQQPVDEIYKANFWKRKQKQMTSAVVNIGEKRKRAAMDIIKGN